MKILVLNPNTSEAMTAEIAGAARAVAVADTEIVAAKPWFGAEAIDSAAESHLSAVGVMDVVASMMAADTFDAVILAGFGEHGKDALPEMLTSPHTAHRCGRAGLAGVTAAISAKLGVPAVDGVAAAVATAQGLTP
jgi:Asp/Glu/hydantoin racemase